MLAKLKEKLEAAEGRSEFVIAMVCDIRGFSDFSIHHESPDTAMFIKRFYIKLLDDYFSQAAFAKPTGDGLLLIFKYSKNELHEVSRYVIEAAFSVLSDFPSMFKDDPMINYPTPTNLGFGIARGSTCCLFSKRSVLDYSGQLLNLTSRLNDLARPKGIVIAGSYLFEVIPESVRSQFQTQQVYVRGIAEETPIDVFHSSEVKLPGYALFPLSIHDWKLVRKEFSVEEINKLQGNFNLKLPEEPVSSDMTKLEISWKNPLLKGYVTKNKYTPYTTYKDASGHYVRFSLNKAKTIIKKEKLDPTTIIYFNFHYVPKAMITTKLKT